MSHVGIAVFRAKRYEAALRRIGGTGRGLGQLIASCAEQLPACIIEQLRELRRLRNILVHEDRIERLAHPSKFVTLVNVIEDGLGVTVPEFAPKRMELSDLDVKPVSATAFVANLSTRIDELDLYDLFNAVGRTLAVELAVRQNNTSRGIAMVHMAETRGAREAVANFDGKKLYGRKLIVFVSGSGRGIQGDEESVARVMAQREVRSNRLKSHKAS